MRPTLRFRHSARFTRRQVNSARMRYRPPVRSRPANRPEPMAADLAYAVMRATAWADPADVASAFADEIHACVLLSDSEGWSYVLRRPDAVVEAGRDLPALLGAGQPL